MNVVTRIDEAAPRLDAPTAITPYDMLNQAVTNGSSIEVVTRLMDLHERWEANRARKAFDAALSDAKAEIGPITKNRRVNFESNRGGSKTDYRHEDLAEIARSVDPVLAAHGLSYRFQTTQEGDKVRVTCMIAHRDGHSETNSLAANVDSSGNKNHIQAIGSVVTYLQRYTLKSALGLAASNDDDGKAVTVESPSPEYITPDQVEKLRSKIIEVGADPVKLLVFLKLERLEDIYAKEFGTVLAIIEKKAGR